MSVFDNFERTLQGGLRHPMASFTYLNLSARAEADRVRRMVDDMLARYPADKRDNLRDRLRSLNETTHQAAFFELALHEIVTRQRCRVVAIEPPIPGTDRSPDFLVQTPEGGEFYLEATLASGESESDAAGRTLRNDAIAEIDQVHCPRFSLVVRYDGVPAQPIARPELRQEVQVWVDSLDFDQVSAEWKAWREDGGEISTLSLEKQGLRLEIEAVPRNEMGDDNAERAIGLLGLITAITAQPHTAIRQKVLKKGARYGDLGLPYIVAVNSLSQFAVLDSVVPALFGTEAYSYRPGHVGGEWYAFRNRDGAWYGRNGAQHTRVSAVLSVERLSPWNLARQRMRLTLNPWAQRPLAADPIGVDRCWRGDDEILQFADGLTVGEILGIDANWPG